MSRFMSALGAKSDSWARCKYSIGLGSDSDRFIYKEEESLFYKEVKKFFSLRYTFLYDVVFLNFGSTLFTPFPKYRYEHAKGWDYIRLSIYSKYRYLMRYFELTLLKLFKPKIFVQYQGSDARQKWFCQKNFEICIPSCKSTYTKSDLLKDRTIDLQIRELDKVASGIYSLNPDLLHVLPNRSKFLPYCHIDLGSWKIDGVKEINKPIRIGHAPSNRSVKGTEKITEVINLLQKTHSDCFEFVLIEDTEINKAKEIYKSLDLLIDQIYVGWYGGLAVELMALETPVICYLREDDLDYIPEDMKNDLPIIRASPETLQSVLEKVFKLTDIEIINLGIKSREFVEKWHNPETIVKSLLTDFGFSKN
jgi:hypothetical protein